MDRRQLKITKVGGSTILEVLISMIVIIVVFGIAMMIYGNVIRSSLSAKKIHAQALLQERLLAIEHRTDSQDETVTVGDFLIGQEIKGYGDSSHLIQVHLTAWDNNHQRVAELRKVIINP